MEYLYKLKYIDKIKILKRYGKEFLLNNGVDVGKRPKLPIILAYLKTLGADVTLSTKVYNVNNALYFMKPSRDIVDGVIKKKSKKKKKAPTSSEKFFKSERWKRLRYIILRRDNYKCLCCNATREDGVKLHVDHIKPRSKYPDLEWREDNLQTLCEDCNIGKSNLYEHDFRS